MHRFYLIPNMVFSVIGLTLVMLLQFKTGGKQTPNVLESFIYERAIPYLQTSSGFVFWIFVFFVLPFYFFDKGKKPMIPIKIGFFLSWLLGWVSWFGSIFIVQNICGFSLAILGTVTIFGIFPIALLSPWYEGNEFSVFSSVLVPLVLAVVFRYISKEIAKESKDYDLSNSSFDIFGSWQSNESGKAILSLKDQFKNVIGFSGLWFAVLLIGVNYSSCDCLKPKSRENIFMNTSGSEEVYWLTRSSKMRHNASCKWYKKTKGFPCKKEIGHPCKICGG